MPSGGLRGVWAVVELCVSLKSFINIELRSQGWYALRVKVSPDNHVRAVWPYALHIADDAGDAAPPDHQALIEDGWSCRSKAFKIRYQHEEASLGETFMFKVVLGQLHSLDHAAVCVELELLLQEGDMQGNDLDVTPRNMKVATRDVIRISNVAAGAHAYYGCTFDNEHFGLCHTTVFAALAGFTTQPEVASWGRACGRNLFKPRGSSWLHHAVNTPSKDRDKDGYALNHSSSLQSSSVASTVGGTAGTDAVAAPAAVYSPAPRGPRLCSSASAGSAVANRYGSFSAAAAGVGTGPWSLLSALRAGLTVSSGAAGSGRSFSASAVSAASASGVALGGAGHAPTRYSPHPPTHVQHAQHVAAGEAQHAQHGLLERVAALYGTLVVAQSASLRRFQQYLKGLPRSCFYPQTYNVLRMLYTGPAEGMGSLGAHSSFATAGGAAAAALAAGLGPEATPRGADASIMAAVGSWPEGLDAEAFVQRLPPGCTPAVALQYLDAALKRVANAVSLEWQVLQWVVQYQLTELHRYAKCCWELDQPELVTTWMCVNTCMQDSEAELATAGAMRQRLKEEKPYEVPQVHQVCFWDKASDQPLFYIDDSLAHAAQQPHSHSQPQSPAAAATPSRSTVPAALTVAPAAASPSQSSIHLSPISSPRARLASIGPSTVVAATAAAGGAAAAAAAASSPRHGTNSISPSAAHGTNSTSPNTTLTPRGLSRRSGGIPLLGVTSSVPPAAERDKGREKTSTPGSPAGQSPGKGASDAARGSNSTSLEDHEGVHVVVFVHGYQGSSTDLGLIKGHLSLLFPYLECVCSKVNENNTNDSIQDMASRLADEVVEVVAPFQAAGRRPLKQLSFVGHSIGNLILRAALALPQLAPYHRHLHMYLSISGPHLGFLYSSNALVDAGMSVLKSFSRGKCLHQLDLTDASHVEDTCLYRLAVQSNSPLQHFKHVVLVSSPQDRYVPHHSARISMCAAARKDHASRKGIAFRQMVEGLMRGVGQPGGPGLIRVDVDFSLKSKGFSISKLVGRTAHIEFIENEVVARLLVWGIIHRYRLLPEVQHAWL